MYIPRLVRAVQLNRQMETGTKKKTHKALQTHTQTLSLQLQVLDIPSVHPLKCLQCELCFPLQLPANQEPDLSLQILRWQKAHPDYLAGRSVSVRGEAKASVGVIWGRPKVARGHHGFTTRCVVIKMQGNIWELVHAGAPLSHSLVSLTSEPDFYCRCLITDHVCNENWKMSARFVTNAWWKRFVTVWQFDIHQVVKSSSGNAASVLKSQVFL